MVEDAKVHAQEDEEKKKLVDTQNKAEQMVFQTRKMLNDNKDKIDAGKAAELEKACDALDKVKKSDNLSELESAIADFEKSSHAIAEELYRASQTAGANPNMGGAAGGAGEPNPGGQAQGGKKDDNVVDADFKVVDDDKK